MFDIVFVNPPNHCKEDYIPLGLQNLYAIIKHAGYSTDLIDLQKLFIQGKLDFNPDVRDQIHDIIRPVKSKIYAFTVWNTSFAWVIDLCQYIKSTSPQAVTIIGGPLSTLSSGQILKDYDFVDIACRFEGEIIIEPLVRTILAGDSALPFTIPNMSYRSPDGAVHSTPDAPLIDNLDTLPHIDVTPSDFNSPVLNLEAGRGCSFRCYYCSSCYIWKYKPRYKSGSRLFSEIAHLCDRFKTAGMNPPVFHLEHDNFLMRPEVLVELDRNVQETGLRFQYGFAGRADLVSEKNLDLLRRTGCVYVFLGIETGSERMQKITRKNLSFHTVFSSIHKLQKQGIMVNANVMYGFPEETLEDLHATLTLVSTLRFLGVIVYVSMLSPEPNTPVGEASSLADYLYNGSSPYAAELTASGFKPEEYRRIYLNHLYTLKNSHYDILRYHGFVRFWHAMVRDYPMTVYAFTQKSESDWNHRFSVWDSQLQGRDLDGFSKEAITDLFRLFDPQTDWDDREAEITSIEYHLRMHDKKNGSAPDLSKEQLRMYYTHCNEVWKETMARLGANTVDLRNG